MKAKIIFFLLFFLNCNFDSQENNYYFLNKNTTLKQIIDSVNKATIKEKETIFGKRPPTLERIGFIDLSKYANNIELIELTNYKNPYIRCYSFYALVKNQDSTVYDILKKHIKDTAKIQLQSGCFVNEIFVGDYFYNIICDNNENSKFSKLHLSQIDSLLINEKNIILEAKSNVIKRLKPTNDNYLKIRNLVINENNTTALIILAKYKKKSDIDLISNFFKDENSQIYALEAVIEYPSIKFYPYLKDIFNTEWKKKLYDYQKWRLCIEALTLYPNKETISLFEKTISTNDNFRYSTLTGFIEDAVELHPNKIFNPLIEKINQTDQ
jgi:hypothetical protein